MNDAIETLLAELVGANAKEIQKRLRKAMRGRDADTVIAAVRNDARFLPILHRVAKDALVVSEIPWIMQSLGRHCYEAAVPELLTCFRTARWGAAEQAARALLQIKSERALLGLEKELPRTKLVTQSLEASLALARAGSANEKNDAAASERFFRRIEPFLGAADLRTMLYYLLQKNRALFKAGPKRWLALATADHADASSKANDAARELLATVLSPAEQRALFAPRKDALQKDAKQKDVGKKKESTGAALTAARDLMLALRDALPKSTWKAPPRTQVAKLRALETIVGPLPAIARALHETFGSIHVQASRPRDSFVVYGLAEALDAAKAWKKKNAKASPALRESFLFPIAPDGYEKAGLSGGPPVSFAMPWVDDDPELLHLRGRPRLSAFLAKARRLVARQSGKD